jgi:hypothetical protein
MARSILNRLRRLFHRPSVETTGIPEVIGYRTDQAGKQQPVVRGSIKHGSLSNDQRRRVAHLRNVLSDAYPMTMEGWIDGFLRDAHPENEIQIIEACAYVYQHLSADSRLSFDEKRKLYSVVCAISAGAPTSTLDAVLPVGRGLPNAQTITAMLEEAWRERRGPQ